MHELTLNTKIPSLESTVVKLQESINRLGVFLDYDRMLEHYARSTIGANILLERIIRYTNAGVPVTEYKEKHFDMFCKKAGIREGLLTKPKSGTSSYSEDSIAIAIGTGLYNEELCAIMRMYSEACKKLHAVSVFKKIFDECLPCGVETFDNHRMVCVKPIAVPQNTQRVGYHEPAIMNFAKEVSDVLTSPKGWILKAYDSGQIEPRLAQSFVLGDPLLKYCTQLYNDAYYGYVHYCNILTDEQIASGNMDFAPIEITDELKEKRKKFKTFGNAVLYGSTENKLGDPDKANFIRRIGGHPKRIALQRDAETRVMNGQTVFYTAFGTPIDIMKGPSAEKDREYSAEEQFKRKVKRAINNPIQGTAADLMRYSVSKAYNYLLKEAPASAICVYVHDSGKFLIHESEYDKVKDTLSGITAYQVEDWLPIYCEEENKESSVPRYII